MTSDLLCAIQPCLSAEPEANLKPDKISFLAKSTKNNKIGELFKTERTSPCVFF